MRCRVKPHMVGREADDGRVPDKRQKMLKQANELTEGISDSSKPDPGTHPQHRSRVMGGLMGCRVEPHMVVRAGGR